MTTPSSANQLAGFIAKFDPAVAKLIRSCRGALRRRFPTAIELVYDNYNFFVIAFASSERTSDCFISLASYARGVRLFFVNGAKLPDPHKILEGGGKQVRSIRVENAAVLATPAVEALFQAALAQAKVPLPSKGPGCTIIKSISAKQRPRRASA